MLQNAEISKNFWRKIKRTGGGFTAAPAPLILGCAVALIRFTNRIQKGFLYQILLYFHFNSFLRKANHPTQDKMIVNPTEYIG